jgi:hypothetical protein
MVWARRYRAAGVSHVDERGDKRTAPMIEPAVAVTASQWLSRSGDASATMTIPNASEIKAENVMTWRRRRPQDEQDTKRDLDEGEQRLWGSADHVVRGRCGRCRTRYGQAAMQATVK